MFSPRPSTHPHTQENHDRTHISRSVLLTLYASRGPCYWYFIHSKANSTRPRLCRVRAPAKLRQSPTVKPFMHKMGAWSLLRSSPNSPIEENMPALLRPLAGTKIIPFALSPKANARRHPIGARQKHIGARSVCIGEGWGGGNQGVKVRANRLNRYDDLSIDFDSGFSAAAPQNTFL